VTFAWIKRRAASISSTSIIERKPPHYAFRHVHSTHAQSLTLVRTWRIRDAYEEAVQIRAWPDRTCRRGRGVWFLVCFDRRQPRAFAGAIQWELCDLPRKRARRDREWPRSGWTRAAKRRDRSRA